MECVGTEKFLLRTTPKDMPLSLGPIFNELHKTKESLKLVHQFFKQEHTNWWTRFIKEKEDEEINFEAHKYKFPLFELAKTVREERENRTRTTNMPNIPQIVHDDDPIEPIVIGKENRQTNNHVEEGCMVLCNIQKYEDDWPQVAKVVKVHEDTVTVTWYKGWTGTWLECTKPVPGQRGKRMACNETIQLNDIWYQKFELSQNGKLPRNVKNAIDNFHMN